MKITPAESIPLDPVAVEGAAHCAMRELFTARDGAPTFAMRQFEIQPGGNTPYHTHPWEHEVYILAGEGLVRTMDGEQAVCAGDAVLVLPDERHSFANRGGTPLRFLCMIPVEQSCCR